MLEHIYENSTKQPIKKGMLYREQLNKRLSDAVQMPLVMVIGGAGYGKTQSVSSFIYNESKRSMWLNLCELDNLPSRFWEVFSYALSQLNQELGESVLSLGFPDSLHQYNQFLSLFAEELYSGEQIHLVFDDFHNIYEPKIYQFVERLVGANLENICIFLLSRHYIQLQVPGAFSKNIVQLISQNDLMFSLEETKQFLKEQNYTLNKNKIEQIWKKTEGWPLVTSLIALSDIEYEHISADISYTDFSLIKQLFEKEFFNDYSSKVQKLFIKLSMLEHFSIDILRKLSVKNLEEFLHILSANMFVRFETGTETYYMHNLFRNFLAEKQILLSSEEIQEVFFVAARCSERQDMKTDALSYYHKIKEYSHIWSIIKRAKMDCGEEIANYYLKLLHEFPEDFVNGHPYVEVVQARLMLNNGRFDECKSLCSTILQKHTRKEILGEIYLILGLLCMIMRSLDFVKYFKLADTCLEDGSKFFSNKTFINNMNYSVALNNYEYGEAQAYTTALLKAMPCAARAMNGGGYGMEYFNLSETAYFQGDTNKAVEYAYQTIYHSREQNQYDLISMAYFVLIRVSIFAGKCKDALELFERLKTSLAAVSDPRCQGYVEFIKGWLYAKLGQIDEIPDWLIGHTMFGHVDSPNSEGRMRFIRSYCYLEQEKYQELIGYLDQLEVFYRTRKIVMAHNELLLLKAIAHSKLNHTVKAMECLEQAYLYTYKNNLIMKFVEYGNYTRTLINIAKKSDTHSIPDEWLNNISTKATTYAKRLNYVRAEFRSLHERKEDTVSLTPREKEILSSLSQGLTRSEIANERGLSINTVKSNLKNIYSKLGAVNKADAIRIAATMNLL